MIWPIYPVSHNNPYHCAKCDVYGAGKQCWSCGSKKVKTTSVPGWTMAHRHDPAVKYVPIGSAQVPIRRELKRIIP